MGTGMLPGDVVQGEFGTGWYYERFSPFTWDWVWRRTILLGALAVPFGAMLGIVHGLFAHRLEEGMAVGWRSAVSMLFIVALGPSLAAMVRNAAWPRRREVAGVVACVAIGIVASWSARTLALEYHDQLMGEGFTTLDRVVHLFGGDWPIHSLLENGTDLLATLTVHAVGGGALALRSYLDEPRRLRNHAEQRELAQLRLSNLAAEARLAVLQAQVEPHFLFNTLATASATIDTDPARARDLILALSQYLRATLPSWRGGASPVRPTLAEQFDLCRRYLEVMALRLGGRLTFVVSLPETLATVPFPSLLLISLVENAVTHGIEAKSGAVRIELRAQLSRDDPTELEVLVIDDGVGLDEGLVEGTGISNVRSQLAMLHGAAARFRLESPPEGGARASIVLPMAALNA